MQPIKQFLNSAVGQGAPILVNGQLVANANQTLRHEEHLQYDQALLQVATRTMTAAADLRSRGLVRPLGGIGVLLSLYERVGELTDASISMDGRTRSDKDRLTFDDVGVPIPIFHKEWELGARQLASSRSTGAPLDTSTVEIAGRIVTEKIESHIFNGVPGLSVGGSNLYGYCTHPDRNTYTLQADWTADTGAAIVQDVLEMVQLQRDDHFRGPFVLYVGSNYASHLQTDYAAAKGDNTIMQRIEAIREISEVKVADFLASDEVVMVQMTSDVVDLAVAVDLQNIQWSVQPMSTDFMTYAMLAVRVKSEKNQRCGVCHASPA